MSSVDAKLPAATRLRSLPVLGVTVATMALVAAVQGSVADAVLRALLVALLVPCALIDLERRVIPNRITGPGSLLAIVLGLALAPGSEATRLLWALGAGGFLLLAALANPAGMGMGDVKLVGMMGLFLGAPVAVALLLALLATIVTAVVLALGRGVGAARKTALPFGPYLAAGGLVAAFAGLPLLHAYLSLHG